MMTIPQPMEKMIAFSEGSIHDIACPLCRERYGNTNGKHQEAEGAPMAAADHIDIRGVEYGTH